MKRSYEWDPLHSPSGRCAKRQRCTPLTVSPPSVRNCIGTEPSPFPDFSSKLTTEQIARNIRDEIKRIQRRKHLQNNVPECSIIESPASSTSGLLSPSRKDEPLFTYRHVELICERVMKERESKIREEYDKILSTKLAEQYDTFVKFTHEQVQRRFENCTPSYLS